VPAFEHSASKHAKVNRTCCQRDRREAVFLFCGAYVRLWLRAKSATLAGKRSILERLNHPLPTRLTWAVL
jgi:hypothetical protein